MKVGTTLLCRTRAEWRAWLAKNYATAPDIWLIYFKKNSGKSSVAYADAVEEALCYGWIDSIAKGRDDESWVQRFSPRRPKSVLSELNKERIRKMIRQKKMRAAGLRSVAHHLDGASQKSPTRFVFPKDILDILRKDPLVWKHYRSFPLSYRRIRIGWIDSVRNRPQEFRKRLAFFIKKTKAGTMFGSRG